METSEILKKVRQIEIKTRGLSNNIFAGQYHSAFKGRGMSFSEVREYQFGDDIRDIDWNVTARFNKPYVKVFEEERELTVMLMVDVSGSLEFGTIKPIRISILHTSHKYQKFGQHHPCNSSKQRYFQRGIPQQPAQRFLRIRPKRQSPQP